MSNEIKQGDKVRVSKDAPKVYVSGLDHVYLGVDSTVIEIEDGNAVIRLNSGNTNVLFREIAIPTKYLVKVDAEAKEAKFKVNDVVRTIFNETTHITSVLENGNYYLYGMENEYPEDSLTLIRSYAEPTTPKVKAGDRVRNIESGLIGVVDKIVYENIVWVNGVDGKRYHWKSDKLELVEPTEQTEAEKKPYDGISEETANEISDMLEAYAKALSGIADSFDWQRYEADLAKEIAVKVANKYTDPKEAAEYAVKVAEAVVAGLKRK